MELDSGDIEILIKVLGEAIEIENEIYRETKDKKCKKYAKRLEELLEKVR